ncbi:MAG: hypothetical protein H7Z75_19740 [Ferruginibacter sp.]|nr:hypothetical protein [Cytophagales bacterium]
MRTKSTLHWLHFSLFGLTLWFFGNFYEEVILMPNWLAAPIEVLKSYNRYYSVVIQYHYYVPVTQLAVVTLIVLCFTKNPARQIGLVKLRRAAVWGTMGLLLTAYVVLTINLDLFIGELRVTERVAHQKGLVWMIANAARLFCVGLAFRYTFQVRDQLRDKLVAEEAQPSQKG